MSQLRVGIIGLGVGEQHILGYNRAESARVVALCDMDSEKLATVAEKYPNCTTYTAADAMIDAPDTDVISIASFDHNHAEQVIRSLDRGKHVFCEKPLCVTEAELAAIKQACNRNPGVRLSTNTILRMSPRFCELREKINRDELGSLYYIEADYNYGRLFKLKDGWRGRIPNYSVMLGGGIHVVDLVLWLVGGRVVEVFAAGNKICSVDYGFSTPDMVVAILRFDNGVLAKVAANFGCVYPHFHNLTVYGTKATFVNGQPNATLYHSRDRDESPELINTDYPGIQKGDLIPGFVDAIRGIGRAKIEESELFATMEVCLAIDRSWRDRASVVVGG